METSATDYYTILGVPRTSTHEEIRRVYRRLSMQMHPDRNRGDDLHYKEINNAYDTLGDPARREQYNIQLQMSERFSSLSHGPPMDNPSEHAAALRRSPGGAEPKVSFPGGGRPPACYGAPFPLRCARSEGEARFGSVSLNGGTPPPVRHGDTSFASLLECLFDAVGARAGADGGGHVRDTFYESKPDDLCVDLHISLEQAYVGCTSPVTVCRSIVSGNVYGAKEHTTSTETIYVEIPEGTDHDENIRVAGVGHRFYGIWGDVCVRVAVESPTGALQRNGMDLFYHKSISLREALCGVRFEVVLFGKRYHICNDEGSVIPPAHTKVLKGMGMRRGGHTGNLVIVFTLRFPKTIPPDVCAWLNTHLPESAEDGA